jgi:hypothetical protein
MANQPAEVQRRILTRLRNEQENELKLINNLFGEIARIIRQSESRAPEVERLRELPQDYPIVMVGLQTLLRNDETDVKLQVTLKMVREQVLQVWEEKSQLIDNYKSI